jgi:hypothetical protein
LLESLIYSIGGGLNGALEIVDAGAVWTKGVSGLSLTSTESRAGIVFWGVRPALFRHPDSSAISVISV